MTNSGHPGASGPPPRGTLNEERWDEVLSVAAVVFGEKGYRAATLRDIASRLGMLKGSLYYYIDSKEDLLFEILKRSHLQGVEFVGETAAMSAAAPADRLARLIRNWMAGVESLPPELNISETDFRLLKGERRRQIVALRAQIAKVPQDIISAGIAEGSFNQSVDPYVATATLMRILNTTQQWYRPGRGIEWTDVTEWYVQLMLGGLQAGAWQAGTPAQTVQKGTNRSRAARRRAGSLWG
jgi:AcrR family transcriptional regulator